MRALLLALALLACATSVSAQSVPVFGGGSGGSGTGSTCIQISAGVVTLQCVSGANTTSFGFAPSYSTGEVLMSNSVSAQNVLTLQNNSTSGFSVIAVRDSSSIERAAFGFGNSASSGGPWPSRVYLEAGYYQGGGEGVNPASQLIFVQTGFLSGARGTRVRQMFDNDGMIYFMKVDGTNSDTSDKSILTVDSINSRVGILAPVPVAAFDMKGLSVMGNAASNRSTVTGAFGVAMTNDDDNVLRLVHNNIVKVDVLVRGTSNVNADRRVEFVDSDNGSVLPLTLKLNGTASAKVNGQLEIGGSPTTALTKSLFVSSTAFASLGTPDNGTVAFCSDCDPPTLVDQTCASAGTKTGSLAVRVNGAWKCIS